MAKDFSSAPGFEASVGGMTFKQVEPNGVHSILVEDHVDMSSICVVTLGTSEQNPAWNFSIGDPVLVKMRNEEPFLFKGEVTAIEHSFQIRGASTLTLRCVDNTHRLGRGRKTRFWNDVTDSDVAQEVASESGLSVEADPTDETHSYILQRNESNIAFLKRLAARNNFQVRVEQGTLFFKKPSFSGASKTISMGENLISMNTSFNSGQQVQEVVVRGWDIKEKKEIVGRASAGDVAPIGGGEIGAQKSNVFGESTAYISDVPVQSQAMADTIAKAEMERLARQFCRGKCNIRGDNNVRAGVVVDFSGFSQGLNGSYYVVGSRHLINPKTGYSTEFSFCSNTFGA